MSTLLDTNIDSELMRESPEPSVARWASGHPVEDLFPSAVSEAELRYGASILPMGRRREALFFGIEAMLSDAFEDRMLPFDSKPLVPTATSPPRAAVPGVPWPLRRIAAIAAARRLSLATRNVRDFEETGIEIVDPWAGV